MAYLDTDYWSVISYEGDQYIVQAKLISKYSTIHYHSAHCILHKEKKNHTMQQKQHNSIYVTYVITAYMCRSCMFLCISIM